MECHTSRVTGGDELQIVRDLFREYEASLAFDLDFQGFEDELASLPGRYGPPTGSLLLARLGEEVAGCVAVRALEAGVCEMKRLFVRPGFRGHRVGASLGRAILDEARSLGYASMRLDTVTSMTAANRLYESLGFRSIAAYCENPLPDAEFKELRL